MGKRSSPFSGIDPDESVIIMSERMIEPEAVTVRKSRGLPLDGVSLRVSRHELAGIIGPNGAGKTTLLNVIAGFETFEGALRLFG
jgi:ABC-type Mn2+/Zn2+ transport system ATPase subunit